MQKTIQRSNLLLYLIILMNGITQKTYCPLEKFCRTQDDRNYITGQNTGPQREIKSRYLKLTTRQAKIQEQNRQRVLRMKRENATIKALAIPSKNFNNNVPSPTCLEMVTQAKIARLDERPTGLQLTAKSPSKITALGLMIQLQKEISSSKV